MQLETQTMVELLSQWNRCHGAFYQIRESDLRWNLSEQEYLTYQVRLCDGVPILCAVATKIGVAHGIPSHTFWLSLYGEIAEKSETSFVTALLRLAEEAGKTRIAIGADEFHFMPGLPEENEAELRLKQALLAEGFQGVEAVDFVGSLQTEPVLKLAKESEEKARAESWVFRQAESESDLEALDHFLMKEFPGRWRREFLFWRGREDAARASWALLWSGEEILGFARYGIRSRISNPDFGWTPGALRFALSPNEKTPWADTDSCLGPIGMAASQRGKGTGRVLLGLTLSTLQRNNAKRLCIDWTNAYNYYMPLGFEVARNYWNSWKSS